MAIAYRDFVQVKADHLKAMAGWHTLRQCNPKAGTTKGLPVSQASNLGRGSNAQLRPDTPPRRGLAAVVRLSSEGARGAFSSISG